MIRIAFLGNKAARIFLGLGAVLLIAGIGYFVVSAQKTADDAAASRKVTKTAVSNNVGSTGDETRSSGSHAAPVQQPPAAPAVTSDAWPASPATPAVATNGLLLAASSTRPKAGDKLTVVLYENSGAAGVNSVQTKLTFDPTQLEYIGTVAPSDFDIAAATDSRTPGIVQIARATVGQPLTGTKVVATLHFNVKQAALGDRTIAIDDAASYIVRAADADNILQTVVPAVLSIQSR